MVKQLNSEVKQQQLEWRRAQVLELSSQGYSQREIAISCGKNPIKIVAA
jgi:hypothetical protein